MKTIQQIKHYIDRINPIDFALQLTIFFIVIHFSRSLSRYPLLFIPVIISGAIGILIPQIRSSKLFWALQTSLYFIWVFFNWQTIDNHMYLWGYWLLSITVSFYAPKQSESIKISARLLIVFCMGYAVLQKVLSSTYLDGSFFYYKLLTDSRFIFIGTFIQHDMSNLINSNREYLELMRLNAQEVTISFGPKILKIIGQFLTWYTIIIEAVLAVIFCGFHRRFHMIQHSLLLFFATIYFLLPIKGFAFTLLTMGFVLLKNTDFKLKSAYLFFYIYIFAIATYFNEFAF